jgi:3-methyl-2-oxobutanoate hydroxymethyltransferase
LVMLTAYDYPSAVLAERAGLRFLLVGDSLGMVVQGHGTTLPVTLDAMVYHTAAVTRGAPEALVVADLPFLTYATPADAVASARRLMQEAGAHAVKLEGGGAMASTVRHLTALGVPVMGHLGFTPQAQHQLGIRVQGKQADEAARLLQDAKALEEAGAFAIVLELVPAQLAAEISQRLSIPTIGIGAGPGCDGQVQVWHDVLGLYPDVKPRHAKRYAEVGEAIQAALSAYAAEVRAGDFPTAQNSSSMKDDQLAAALGQAGETA